MAAFVRSTATPAVLSMLNGARLDLQKNPQVLAMLATLAIVTVHALTFAP